MHGFRARKVCQLAGEMHVVTSTQLMPRPHSWTLLRCGLLVVASTSLGVVAGLNQRAAQRLFAALPESCC